SMRARVLPARHEVYESICARHRIHRSRAEASSADDIYGREEADPHHVDEVPVDRRGLDGQMAPRRELALGRSEQADRVEHHTPGHVRAVEPGEREEHAREDPVTRQETETGVLVALADEEERAQDDGR